MLDQAQGFKHLKTIQFSSSLLYYCVYYYCSCAFLKPQLRKKLLLEHHYSEKKFRLQIRVLRTKLLYFNPDLKISILSLDEKMLNQIKKKFISTKNKSTKMQITKCTTKNLMYKNNSRKIQVSNFAVRKAKQFVT